MEFYDLFYKWVPLCVRIPVLCLIYLVLLTANGIYLGNINEMYSSAGGHIESYTLAYNAMYIGMGFGFMTNLRMRSRFSGKSLLMGGLLLMLVFNIICATTTSPGITVVSCFFIGLTKVAASTELYLVWLGIWSKKLDTSRVYPYVYFTALCGLYFMNWITALFAQWYNWRYAYIFIVLLLLICILLTRVLVEKHPLKKKIPLYQLDWIGVMIGTFFLMSVNYILVFGNFENWFESKKIIASSFLAFLSLLWFLHRELSFKRPVFPMDLFRLSNFRMGLVYFILIGVFVPSTLQTSFSSVVLHYENYRNAQINLYLIPGVIAGAALCYYWYHQSYDVHLLLIIGFLMMTWYYIIVYFSFSTAFDPQAFWMPSVVRGFGTAILFIAAGLYITRGHIIIDVLTVGGIALLFRSFLGGGTFTAIFVHALYTQRIRHLSYIAGKMDDVGSGSATLNANLQLQASLAALKEISGYIVICGLAIISVLLIRYFYLRLMSLFTVLAG